MPGSAPRGEILAGPDGFGRYTFFVFVLADYHPGHPDGECRTAERGQIFFGPLPDDVAEWTDRRPS